LNFVAGLHEVVPPHVALKRELPWSSGVKLIGIGETDESMEITLLPVLEAADAKSAAVWDGLGVFRQPDKARMIAIIINF
jgi:hypothetical protein